MTTGLVVHAPAGPQVTTGPIRDFDLGVAARIAVVVGPRSPSKRFQGIVAAATGRDLETWDRTDRADHPDGPVVLRSDAGAAAYAALGARVGRLAEPGRAVDCLLGPAGAEELRRFAAAAVVAAQYTKPLPERPEIRLWCATAAQGVAAGSGARLGARVLLARQLANTPASTKSPAWLADQGTATLRGVAQVRVRQVDWLARHGFGGVLAVGRGSSRPPNVTQLEYRGSGAGPHVVLVGKGITFDSGGLSLKPPPSMPLMKTDMSGAAAVIAAVACAADLALPLRVTGLIACAENVPSGSAMRPGDVVRHHGGRTTEVLNTDAEGRLVLADCLAYAARTLEPDVLVDVATLTGAATVGLGRQHAALLTMDDRLARQLVRAGERSGDAVWRLPLADDYRPAIGSHVADAANMATDSTVQAGAITAALFLQPFAGRTRWAHLDIAGAGRTESDRSDCRKGATGFGVSLLAEFLSGLASSPR